MRWRTGGAHWRLPVDSTGNPWPKPDHYTLCTRHTNVTLWLVARFCAEEEKPFRPIGLWDGERLKLTVEAWLNLSAKGRKLPEVRNRWEEAMHNQSLDLPDFGGKVVGNHGNWVVTEYPLIETIVEARARMVQIGAAALQEVMSFG